ncbi:MAG TPA: gliding motility protein GldM [Bacteroidaceae bacterium]|nr:gliding motility protein GldM [Bacteroidaceae bacterium]
MAHGKETPRQKMIGMMYLVLTSMLALNVSKDVLNAFTLVDKGLTTTTENFALKNKSLYDKFSLAYEQNPQKVGDWKAAADELHRRSDLLYDFINECKVDIVSVKESDAVHENMVDLTHVKQKANLDVPGQVMIVNKKAEELKDKIKEYREYLLSLIENKEEYASTVEAISATLDTEAPRVNLSHTRKEKFPESWEIAYFDMMPLASVITILSKMQGDVRNVEAEMLNFLLNQVDARDFRVNVLESVVLPNTNHVFRGQEYRAQVFIAAYDSTKAPEVVLSDGTTLPVEGGKGIYKFTSNTTGTRTWGGVIKLDNEGQIIERPFKAEYTVAEANAVVSPTKMNVFYRGVDNPVSISASGVPLSSIRPTISHGNLRGSSGNYIVRPGPREESSKISVYAELDDGSRKFMGDQSFRVLNLPTPFAVVDGVTKGEGQLTLGQLTRLEDVRAELTGFLFDVKYTVTGFMVSATVSGGFAREMSSSSNKFTSEQKQLFRSLNPGQSVTIKQIKAIGPDGVPQDLNPILIRVR